jgi:hypothetical protein
MFLSMAGYAERGFGLTAQQKRSPGHDREEAVLILGSFAQ